MRYLLVNINFSNSNAPPSRHCDALHIRAGRQLHGDASRELRNLCWRAAASQFVAVVAVAGESICDDSNCNIGHADMRAGRPLAQSTRSMRAREPSPLRPKSSISPLECVCVPVCSRRHTSDVAVVVVVANAIHGRRRNPVERLTALMGGATLARGFGFGPPLGLGSSLVREIQLCEQATLRRPRSQTDQI